MVNLGTVNEDSTVRFQFATAAASGAEENFSATLEQADVVVRKDGADMTLDAATITITNLATGLYEVAIDTSNDADFTTGGEYWVRVDPSDETIDSQAVSGVLGVFTIESASDKAVRLLREFLFPTDSEISTVTSNTTTAINLTDVVDAQTPDDALVGLILAVHDATDDRVEHVVVTSVASLVATVQRLGGGGAMSFTVAAGDHVWIVGYSDLMAGVEGTTTLQESLALQNAAAAGKVSGAATTSVALRDLADTLDRISATVDADGNRTAVTTTFSDL